MISTPITIFGTFLQLIGMLITAFEAYDRMKKRELSTKLGERFQAILESRFAALDSYLKQTNKTSNSALVLGTIFFVVICWFPYGYILWFPLNEGPSSLQTILAAVSAILLMIALAISFVVGVIAAITSIKDTIAKSNPQNTFSFAALYGIYVPLGTLGIIVGLTVFGVLILPIVLPSMLLLRSINRLGQRWVVYLRNSETFPRSFKDLLLMAGVTLVILGLLLELIGQMI